MTSPKVQHLTWGADSTGAKASNIPTDTPVVWPYVTGTPDIIWPASEVARFTGSTRILVDQGYGESQLYTADEFDVESGAFDNADFVSIVVARQARRLVTFGYVEWDSYGAIKGELADRGITRNVAYRIADWNLSGEWAAALLAGDIYAAQWASPTSNPATTIPGTQLTLAQASVDLSAVLLPLPTWQD